MRKASFFQRFLAVVIDDVIFWAIGFGLHNESFMVLAVLYETILVSQWGGHTLGKKVMGIRVVSASGGQVDLLKAFIRSLGKVLSTIVFFLGFVWMLWDKNSQTWHDKLAETNVVQN